MRKYQLLDHFAGFVRLIFRFKLAKTGSFGFILKIMNFSGNLKNLMRVKKSDAGGGR